MPEPEYDHPNPDWPLKQLGLSVRAYNALKNEGYDTIGKVLLALDANVNLARQLHNFGPKCYSEVKMALRRVR
jgi:DNA-directed RNA polymerase alpha subunit